MATISLGSIEAVNESTAVAMGRVVLAALENSEEVEIEDREDIAGDVWSELTEYLARRRVEWRGGYAEFTGVSIPCFQRVGLRDPLLSPRDCLHRRKTPYDRRCLDCGELV